MAELEAEMERTDVADSPKFTQSASAGGAAGLSGAISHGAPARSSNKPSGAYLPPGAMPSQNGVLSKHAAEFWFPECRNCPCCNGFKHGCQCCKGGVNTCTNANCLSTEPVAGQSQAAPAGASTAAPAVSKVLNNLYISRREYCTYMIPYLPS